MILPRSSHRLVFPFTVHRSLFTVPALLQSMPARPRIAITLGDPRGIGPEITAKVLAEGVEADVTLIGAEDQIATLPAARRIVVGNWDQGSGEGTGAGERGRAARAGRIAGHGVETAARLAMAKEVDAIVTAPAHKHALRLAGFAYPGHTEWLAHLAGDVQVAMMLAAEELRVVLVTTHVPLRSVPELLTTELVVRTGQVAGEALRRWWGIADAAVGGLCPEPPRR